MAVRHVMQIGKHMGPHHPYSTRIRKGFVKWGHSSQLLLSIVQMMRELGLDFYRFSLSWSRIMPSSFPDKINEAGVKYYNSLIDELLKYNIQPMVTLFHWDLPQKLQDLGGWANRDIVTWCSDYARTVFQLFGDRVKYFITINESHQVCNDGYGKTTSLDPAVSIKGIAEYMCTKNLLLAHANAYHIYDKEFRPSQQGNIFISYSAEWYEPATNSEADIDAAHYANQFSIKERIAAKSAEQGFPWSRLPKFTSEEIDLIKGSSDFFGLNSTNYIYKNESVMPNNYDLPSFSDDLGVGIFKLLEWKIGESDVTKYVPWGFRKLLNRIRDDYNNIPVYITENGFATHGGFKDEDRVQYYRGYLEAVLDAIDDRCDVRGYTAWSLMDNFEWASGYIECFGLYEVDYSSIYRTRTARKSAYVYKELLRTRELDHHYEPDLSRPITIDDGL